MDKLDATGPLKDRRRIAEGSRGLNGVNEHFAPFYGSYWVFDDFQRITVVSKRAPKTHEEGEKMECRRNYKTATSGVPRELDERTRPSSSAAPAVSPPCRRRSKSCSLHLIHSAAFAAFGTSAKCPARASYYGGCSRWSQAITRHRRRHPGRCAHRRGEGRAAARRDTPFARHRDAGRRDDQAHRRQPHRGTEHR